MKKKAKLSILVPCYNGEKFLRNFFDNLSEQTFQDYELIIVNDGSHDKSDKIIKENIEIFESKGKTVKYVNKPINEGHAKAINDGLKYVNGEYLMWPDIDDHMHADHLKSRIDYMEENQDVDLAIGKVAVYNVKYMKKPIYYAWNSFPYSKKSLIKDFIFSEKKNIGFMSGTFIVKTSSLWNIYPTRNIYSKISVGPTIQMIFPLLYLGKTGYINKCTFDYYIHGINQHLVNEKNQYFKIHEIYKSVCNYMDISQKEKDNINTWSRIVTNRLLLSYALKHGETELSKDSWKRLKIDHGIRIKELIKYIVLSNDLLKKIYHFIWRNNI